MRAVRCHELTGPAALRVDEIDDPPVPSGHVLIDVAAAGVNFPDILITRGQYQFKPPTPFIPGGECAGTIRAVGAGVTDLAVGDRVAASMLYGAYAERVAVPSVSVVKLPANVSFEVGASTILTYATTYHALIDRAHIKSGESLLVLGAAGGVGIAAVELGALLGARVIAAASSDDKLEFCRAHGATDTINYATGDLREQMKKLTGTRGVDVIYDPVGGNLAEPALRSIGWEGRYLVVGFAAGEIPKIPLNLTLLKGCQIVGVFWGSFAMREPAKNRAHCDAIFAHIADGKLKPAIDGVLPFTQAADALARIEKRAVKGKLVLVP